MVELDQAAPRALTPDWTIVNGLAELEASRGRQHELDRFEAGTGTWTFDVSDRALDPMNAASPYAPNVLPGRRLRVRVPGAIPTTGGTLTTSGNEITDAVRASAAAGNGSLPSDGASQPGGFGIFEATTQLLGRTNDLTHSDWTGYYVKPTIIPGQSDPFGGTGAFKWSAYVGGGPGNQYGGVLQQAGTGSGVLAVGTYTVSVWMKSAPGTSQTINWGLKDSHTQAVTVTDQWKQFTFSTAYPGGEAQERYMQIVSQTCQTMPDLYVFAPQCELKPIATPYLPNTGARNTTTTRAAAHVQGPSSFLNATEGGFIFELLMGYSSGAGPSTSPIAISWDDGTANNRIQAVWIQGSGWQTRFEASGVGNGVATIADAFVSGDRRVGIMQWDANWIYLSIGGSPFVKVARTVGNPVGLGAMFNIGSAFGSANSIDSRVKFVMPFAVTLSDADAATINATLSTPTETNGIWDTDASSLFWPDACGLTMVWRAATAAYNVPEDGYVTTQYAEGWPVQWQPPELGETTVDSTDGLAALAQYDLIATLPAGYTGARVNAVLDAIGWSSTARVIATGASYLPAVTFAATDQKKALEYLQEVADTENGLLFVDAQGRVVFIDRHASITSPYTVSQATFSDGDYEEGDGATLFGFDWDLVYNTVTTSDAGGGSYTATNSTSQDDYWPRSLQRSLLIAGGTGETQDAADFLLAQHKDPKLRLPQLVFKPSLDTNLLLQALMREIGDRITVVKTPPTGDPIDVDFFIESISHHLVADGDGPADWTTTFGLAPAEDRDWWIFDTAQFDASAKFAY